MEQKQEKWEIIEHTAVCVALDDDNHCLLFGENSETNARFIAAAPDLLAACKELFALLSKPDKTFKCPFEQDCAKDSCRDCMAILPYHKAAGAIKKATS